MFKSLNSNYNKIISIFLSYLPSRLLVVLNALIIVPVFAHVLTSKEIGVFQLAIGFLNLVCTCSTDWIAKSVLRFYEKYNSQNRLDEFFSNTAFIAIVVYCLVVLTFIFASDYLLARFLIPKNILFLTLLIVIPAGVRQFLYQMLRVLNRPFLYTFSIIIYQISLLLLFLFYVNFIPNVEAVLWAMISSMLIIDFYILKDVKIKFKADFSLNKSILCETLMYALPTIITNTSIWTIINIDRYVFQYNKMFEGTAIAGLSNLFISSTLTPLFSTFLFAVFPTIIKKFERKSKIKDFVTNSIQFYCAIFLPITMLVCCYSKQICDLVFAEKYSSAYILVSFFAVTVFFHELMKIFNVGYHLRNKTYIEMAVSLFAGCVCLFLNLHLIPIYNLLGAGIALLASMLLLFALNIWVQSQVSVYVKYWQVLKTACISILICFASFAIAKLLFIPISGQLFDILQMVLYIIIAYFLSVLFSKKLLD